MSHSALPPKLLPRDEEKRAACEVLIADVIAAEGQKLLVWRDIPTKIAHVYCLIILNYYFIFSNSHFLLSSILLPRKYKSHPKKTH